MSLALPTFPPWTVARCARHDEWRAAYHVENLGFGYYLPQMREWRKGCESRSFVFPGIILIQLRQHWHRLMALRDVFRVIFVPDKQEQPIPAQVRQSEVDEMRRAEGEDGLMRVAPQYVLGQCVRLVDSSEDASIYGIVRGRNPCTGKWRVELRLLGREVIGEFDTLALSLAA